MAKVEAVGIRVGNLLEWNKRVWRVIKCYHVHVGGRGGAFMQVEMKDIEVGTKTNQRFRTEDKVERAFVDPREMQYLYQDGDSFVFMDKQNYEQLSLSADFLEGQSGYLQPNADVQVNFYDGRPDRHRAAALGGAHRSRDGTRNPERHRHQHVQAGEDGHRDHRPGAALHQPGRAHQGQHQRRQLHGARVAAHPRRGCERAEDIFLILGGGPRRPLPLPTASAAAASGASDSSPAGRARRPSNPDVYYDAFVDQLAKLGYVEGKNLAIEWRFADGKYERLPELASELVKMNVEVIVTHSSPGTRAAQQATHAIPIVMTAVGDPGRERLREEPCAARRQHDGRGAQDYRPHAKHLELVRALVPDASRVALLMNPGNKATMPQNPSDIQRSAKQLGMQVVPVLARTSGGDQKRFRHDDAARRSGRDHYRGRVLRWPVRSACGTRSRRAGCRP
jgi:translation elongation factor P/translation initiation factor 5A